MADPKVHALIIGVSGYPHLPANGAAPGPPFYGLNQLQCGALSAFAFESWLKDPATRLPLPLGSVRSFFMPSQAEIQKEPRLAARQTSFGLREIQQAASAWRKDASQDRQSIAYFFFAGHGVQRTIGDAVLILPEFASGIGTTLSNSIDTNNLFYGMAPTVTFSEIARTQLYFIDACRVQPQEFTKFASIDTAPVFDIERTGVDDRSAPIFYAAIPGTVANGRAGNLTYFTESLLQCLTGAGGIALRQTSPGSVPWSVTIHSLNRAVQQQTDAFNLQYGDQQEYQPAGIMKEAIICNLEGPPTVKIKVVVDPDAAADLGALDFLDSTNARIFAARPVRPNPYARSVPAGLYTLSLSFSNRTYRDWKQLFDVSPPEFEMKLRC